MDKSQKMKGGKRIKLAAAGGNDAATFVLIELLKRHPRLIKEISSPFVIPLRTMGRFHLFFIVGKYVLFNGQEYVFSSYSRDVAERNQKEWCYYSKIERY